MWLSDTLEMDLLKKKTWKKST